MTQRDKLIARLKKKPKDFTWDELVRLLSGFGYEMSPTSKTGGSRRRFSHPVYPLLTFHEPHPNNILKRYQMDQLVKILQEEGLL